LAYSWYQRSCSRDMYDTKDTYSQSMDHRLESQIDLASADDLGDILHHQVSNLPLPTQPRARRTYTRIVRLQNRNLDTLILEEPLSLSQVKRSMIRRGVPSPEQISPKLLYTLERVKPTSSSRK
jgi:hypothetical protein